MKVHIIPTDQGGADFNRGKVADAELHFDEHEGPLAGLKLIGFNIFVRIGPGPALNVTFPARKYSVNGESRSFALLRPLTDSAAQEGVRALILAAWRAHEVAAGLVEPKP
jgi:hypothetical protein